MRIMEPFYFPFQYKIMLREHNRKKETVLNVNLKQFSNTAFISSLRRGGVNKYCFVIFYLFLLYFNLFLLYFNIFSPEEGKGVKILFYYILLIFAV